MPGLDSVSRYPGVPAQPLIESLIGDPQYLDLLLHRHVTDFAKKQSAAIGCLNVVRFACSVCGYRHCELGNTGMGIEDPQRHYALYGATHQFK